MRKKFTSKDMANYVYSRLKVTRQEAAEIVKTVYAGIVEALLHNESFEMKGEFCINRTKRKPFKTKSHLKAFDGDINLPEYYTYTVKNSVIRSGKFDV